uniref:Uncharacterized protein n=1 Tax=Micrurus lemniscatus lemniscatus TaxID=129467 RepID=A0A2D4IMW4_MICLE
MEGGGSNITWTIHWRRCHLLGANRTGQWGLVDTVSKWERFKPDSNVPRNKDGHSTFSSPLSPVKIVGPKMFVKRTENQGLHPPMQFIPWYVSWLFQGCNRTWEEVP